MTTQTAPTTKAPAPATDVLARVVVGVDGSPEALEAARQASLLTEPGRPLTLLGAWTVPTPNVGIAPAPAYTLDPGPYREAAEQHVSDAEQTLPAGLPHLTRTPRGIAWKQLIEEARRRDLTLIAVGSHGQGRMRGILVGSTATEIVHRAPCSVLVSRPAGDDFPRRVVVGVDGSPEAAAAYAVAQGIADRFGSTLWPVVARNGKGLDKPAVEGIVGHHYDEFSGDPVLALLAAAAEADLVVVGSRGLAGVKALGSVSEQVAHRARCSVLIVR